MNQKNKLGVIINGDLFLGIRAKESIARQTVFGYCRSCVHLLNLYSQ